MIRLTIALMMTVLAATIARAAGPEVSIIEPRGFGYFLGDKVVREVVVAVPAGVELRASALPQPGPRDYWLDLVESNLTKIEQRSSTTHRLTLTYQVFYAALEPKRLTIPGFKLYFETLPGKAPVAGAEPGAAQDAKPANTMDVAPLEIIVSPLREIIPEKKADSDAAPLRPDFFASPPGTGRARTGLLTSFIAAAILLTALAYHYAWFPFGARRQRPFARAARSLNALPERPQQSQPYSDELLILHRAFDEAYGRRVLSADIEKFFAARPELKPLQSRVAEFYEASDLAFFAGKPDDASRIVSSNAVTFLAHDLARLERRAA